MEGQEAQARKSQQRKMTLVDIIRAAVAVLGSSCALEELEEVRLTVPVSDVPIYALWKATLSRSAIHSADRRIRSPPLHSGKARVISRDTIPFIVVATVTDRVRI